MNKFWNFTDNDDGSRTLMLCGSIADESWYDDDITPKAFREELNAGRERLHKEVLSLRLL